MYDFYFKQKTAYEMRISDWSADLCSSDLGKQSFNSSRSFPGILYTGGQIYLCNGFQRCSVYLSPPMPAQHLNGKRQGMSFFFQQVQPGVYSAQDFFLFTGRFVDHVSPAHPEISSMQAPVKFKLGTVFYRLGDGQIVIQQEIGRASCGERVCQYV